MSVLRMMLFALSAKIANQIQYFKARVLGNQGQFETETESCLNTQLNNINNQNLFDNTSLFITPNAYKEQKLYSVIPVDGSGDMNFVRATTATRVNADGFIEEVPYNTLQRSEEFDNSYWTKTNSTITPSDILIGIQSYNLIPNIDLKGSISRTGVTPQNNTTYTSSIYVKKLGVRYVCFGNITSDTNFRNTIFDLDDKVISYIGTTYINAEIVDLGNNILRLTITYNSIDGNSDDFRISLSSDGLTVNNFIGNGIDGITILGAQIVQGTQPKEYYRTTTRLNIPRIDYSNSSCPSILVEPQRTNIITYSSDFNNSNWTKLETSIIPNAIVSPDGLINASKIVENNVNGAHRLFRFAGSATPRTSSIFAKAGERSKFIFYIGPFGYTFDLINGTAEGFVNTSGAVPTIENYGNGWYRCSLTTPLTANNTFAINLTPDTPTITYQGDGVSGLYIWGAQREDNLNLTSYIPTTTAAVTRNADVINNVNGINLIGQTEGTIYIDFDRTKVQEGLKTIVFIYSNYLTEYLTISIGNNSLLSCTVSIVTSGNNNGRNMGLIEGRNKIAVVYSLSGTKIFFNGVQLAPIANVGLPIMNVINLNNRLNDRQNGPFRTFALWKTQITDAQAIEITTL